MISVQKKLRAVPNAFKIPYHFGISILGHLWYGFPSKHLVVIGITGTKGKSSTAEYINAIFESAGKKTALVNSIRFKIGDASQANTTRMSMPRHYRARPSF